MPINELTGHQFQALLSSDADAAIALLFEHYHTLVYVSIFRLVRNAEEAQDLVQELFLLLLEGKRTIRTDGPVGSYIRRMAVNLAIDHLRKTQSGIFTDVELAETSSDQTSDAALHHADLQSALHNALAALPPKCAAIFVLSRFEALTYTEIAQQLNISKNTVENQMVKALRQLRVLLANHLPELLLAVAMLS